MGTPIGRREAVRLISLASGAVLALGAGCTRDPAASPQSTSTSTTAPTTTLGAVITLPPPSGSGYAWEAIEYGVAKPYLLYKEMSAVLVDTGKSGSGETIGQELSALGLGWEDVEHIIITHHHGDNSGALPEVASLAPDATIWVGAGDRDQLRTTDVDPARIQIASDGDRVADLTIIETPGHTPGHISVLDQAAQVLVDGDLLIVRREELSGPTSDTSDDIDQTYASLAKLALYQYETILIARGDPILEGGSTIMDVVAHGPRS